MAARTAWKLVAVGLGLGVLAGCATTATASGYDVLVTHDMQGRELTIVPQSGVAFHGGSLATEQVKLEFTTEHDIEPGKMLVWNQDHTRLLARLNTSDVNVTRRSGDAFQFSLAPRLRPHAESAKVAPEAAPIEEDTTESLEDQQDDITFAPSDATLGTAKRAPSLE